MLHPDEDIIDNMLGTIEISGKRLILETNSVQRLHEGKNLLLENLSGSLVHKEDIFQDTNEILESMYGESDEKDNDAGYQLSLFD